MLRSMTVAAGYSKPAPQSEDQQSKVKVAANAEITTGIAAPDNKGCTPHTLGSTASRTTLLTPTEEMQINSSMTKVLTNANACDADTVDALGRHCCVTVQTHQEGQRHNNASITNVKLG